MTPDKIASALRDTLADWRIVPLTVPGRFEVRPEVVIEISMTPAAIEDFVRLFLAKLEAA